MTEAIARFLRASLRSAAFAVTKAAGTPLQYAQDNLATAAAADFLSDPRFAEAYRLGLSTGHRFRSDLHIEWRVYTCCWAAAHALNLPGDFVECGVYTGITSRAVMHYVDFERCGDRTFYLLDTFEGIPTEQFTAAERAAGLEARYRYEGTFERVRRTFAAFPNVRIVRGAIPETLAQVVSDRVAYLAIDMNVAAPEIAAIEYFWDRLVPGAVVVLDDYNWLRHVEQRRAFDAFAASRSTQVLALPTGQGMLVKA